LLDEEDAVAKKLAEDNRVSFVEPIAVMHSGISGFQYVGPPYTTDVRWNLDRLDQRYLPLSGSFGYCKAGDNVKIYIVDSGTWSGHQTFLPEADDPVQQNRVLPGYDAFNYQNYSTHPCDPAVGGTHENCGHGTWTASAAIGRTHGTARRARVVPVRVMTATGSTDTSFLRMGLEWIRGQEGNGVISLSAFVNVLPGDPLLAHELVIRDLITNPEPSRRFTVVVSANNLEASSPGCSCSTSPARMAYSSPDPQLAGSGRVITVGGTTPSDAVWSSSCGGACVDIFAPAENIRLAALDYANDNGEVTYSGTSFSAPAVAGLAARFLAEVPSSTPVDIWNRIRTEATPGVLTNSGTMPNLLLYMYDYCRTRG